MVCAVHPRPKRVRSLWRCGEALRLGPRLVHASSSCGADGRFTVGAAGALKDFPVCQRATQAMSVVTLISRMGFGEAQAIGSTSERPLRGEATFVERASLCRAPHELRYEVERPDEIQRAQGQRCVERERDGMPRDVTGRGTGYQLVTVAAAERETDPVGCLDRDGQWHADCNFRACRAACIDGCNVIGQDDCR